MSIIDDTNVTIMAGGEGTRLGLVTWHRAKPAVRFGRGIICDSSVSVAKNAGIKKLFILDQFNPYSLEKYYAHLYRIGPGQEIEFLNPRHSGGESLIYEGTADAVWQNKRFISRNPQTRYHVILSGDHIYRENLEPVLRHHAEEKKHPVTIFAKKVKVEDASRFGVIAIDDTGKIIDFEEKPKNPRALPEDPNYSLVSMGIYIFQKDCLWDLLEEDSKKAHHTQKESFVKEPTLETEHDFGKDIIPYALRHGIEMYTHLFEGYWADVGTDKAYFDTVQDIFLRRRSGLGEDFFSCPSWKIKTDGFNDFYGGDKPYYTSGNVDISHSSLDHVVMSPGCTVCNSELSQTILFGQSEPETERGSEIKDSKLNGIIVDKDVTIQDSEIIGNPGYFEPGEKKHSGLIQIEKGAVIKGVNINAPGGAFIVKPEGYQNRYIARTVLNFIKEVNPDLRIFLQDGSEINISEITRHAS